jgi:hypothetical protein
LHNQSGSSPFQFINTNKTMYKLTFDLDNPSDYKRLRDLVAPSLARYEQTGPPSARLEAGSGDDVPSRVPSTLLPSRYGDPSTWTQGVQQYNDDMRKLLVDARSRPFASAAQRTAAMIDVMLRHPAVFDPSRRVDSLSTEDTNIPANTNLYSAIDRKGENHREESSIDSGTVSKTKVDKEHTLSQIIRELDTALEKRTLVEKEMSDDLPRTPHTSKNRHPENRYIFKMRQHLGQNNSILAQGGIPGKFAGAIVKCKTDRARRCKQEILSNSIDIQIVLGELIAHTKGREVVTELKSFVRASEKDKWLAAYSDAYGVELVTHAKKASAKIKAVLGEDLQASNANHGIPESTRSSNKIPKLIGQASPSTDPAARANLVTCATKALSAPSVRLPGDEKATESPRNGTESADSTSRNPLHGYTNDIHHSTAPESSRAGEQTSTKTKGDVMFYLELEGSADYPQQLKFMEHHDRDQFFQGVSKVFKGKDVKSVTVTISSLPTSNAPDGPDVSYRTWKYHIGRGDFGVSAWAVLRSDLVKILHGPQKSYETVVVKALVYWR